MAAIAATLVLAGCVAQPRVTATAAASRSGAPTTSASAAASTPVATPSSGAPYPMVRAPGSALVSYSLSVQLGDFYLDRMSSWGARVVFNGLSSGLRDRVFLVDLTKGTLEVIARAPSGDEVFMPDIAGDWVVWTEYRYKGPDQAESEWRLQALNLASGAKRLVASGSNSLVAGGTAAPAVGRVDGDLVAYAIEAPRSEDPHGWAIVIQSLTSGEVVRTVPTDLEPFLFDLAGGDLVYSEGARNGNPGFFYNTKLRISTVAHREPVVVDTDAYTVAAGGDRLAWVRDRGAGAAQDPRPVSPVVMTATFSDPTPIQASVLTQGPPPPEGTGRPILGAQFPSAAGNIVAWQDIQTDGTWAGEIDRVAVWDSTTGVASQIEPSPDPLFVGVQGGWLVWNSDPLQADGSVAHLLFGLPLDRI